MRKLFVLRNEINRKQLDGFLQANWLACAQAGKPLAVEIAEHKAKRSLPQNRRLHGILRDISEQAWVNGRQFDTDTWREMFKRKFLGVEESTLPDGTVIECGVSTTTLDVAEFSLRMDQLEAWAVSDLGVEFQR